jgi:inorganic phosphate transporter, PiT family
MTLLFRDVRPSRVDSLFRKGQLLSAAFYSMGHGTNDAQKTMGIIALLLYSSIWKGQSFDNIPFWIVLVCNTTMGLGTLVGGWRIVKTMGSKITKLNPFGGFCAESAASLTLFATAYAGIPVSTTHTITGAIVGYGSMGRLSAVRWGVAGNIVWAWILTIPITGAIGALTYIVASRIVPAY